MKNIILDKYNLEGRAALITGGAGLLGVEHAYALLTLGATVILTDFDYESLIEAEEKLKDRTDAGKLIIQKMDVTSLVDIKNTAEHIQSNSRIDILINNAAIDPKVTKSDGILETSRFENFPLEQWNLQVNVGLTGAFLCSQIFGSAMSRDDKGGVILNIASDLSVISPDQRLYRKNDIEDHMQPVKPVTYSVIKSGLVGLTRYIATYWADKGVRANALSPGGVFTGQDNDFVKRLENLIPMGRMADRDEYHAAIQFLCSDASAYMNGQNIVMDGGRSIW